MFRAYLADLKRSLVLHVILVLLLVFGLSHRSTQFTTSEPREEVNIVEATAVDETQVQAELDRLKAIEARRKQQQHSEQEALERKAQQAKEQRRKEEQRLANLKKKRALEQKKYQEKLARIKAEEEALAKKRADEKKRLEELEKQRKSAEAAADKRKREEELRRQIEEEEKRIATERSKQNQAMIDKYTKLIIAKISRNWIQPPSYKKGMVAVLEIKVLPSGEVVSAKIVKSSGDPAFDRSAELAARKASPLELPDDPEAVAQMRDITITFDPDKTTL